MSNQGNQGNQGLYLAPEIDRIWAVSCANGFHVDLSSDALGITACLHAYRSQAIAGQGEFSQKCILQYALLTEFTEYHADSACIQGLITDTPAI